MIKAIQIETKDGVCESWLAQPNGEGPWPAIILCMDAVGPRAGLFEMAERLATSGYVVLLPNLFYRRKATPIVTGVQFPARPSDIPQILEQIMPLVEKFDSEKALEDMGVFIHFLETCRIARAGKLGIYGYCMGGALALQTAARYPDKFAAVASFHAGGLVTDSPQSPHRLVPKIQASLYVGHADQDPHMSQEQINIFDRATAALTTPHTTELYEGAQHHFTMADLPAYQLVAAEKHWRRLIDLFHGSLSSNASDSR